ncbi:MAG: hypothetical protein CMP68_01710 [Flavobacteriales bacterium]|nr:hypothetical protein [Flavobacteriales bacterium]
MMKNKIKKYKLSFESDYYLFGIQTDAPTHKFIYFINKDLKINFHRDDDLELLNCNQSVYLPMFVYNDFKRDQDWILISNRSCHISNLAEDNNQIFHEKSVNYIHLIPEYKMFNYILKIENFNDNEKKNFKKIKSLATVNLISELNLNLIKNKERLVF